MAAVSFPPGSASAPADVTFVPDLQFAAPGGRPLLADLHLPGRLEAPAPAIVWIHGGGWRSGNRHVGPDLSRFFAACGFATIAVDYRHSGRAIFPAQIEDVKTAIRWVRRIADRYRIDASRIGLWGASSGGHLAALAALTGDDCFTPARCAPPRIFERGAGRGRGLRADRFPADGRSPSAARDPVCEIPTACSCRASTCGPRTPIQYESLLLGAPIATCPQRVREPTR